MFSTAGRCIAYAGDYPRLADSNRFLGLIFPCAQANVHRCNLATYVLKKIAYNFLPFFALTRAIHGDALVRLQWFPLQILFGS